MTAADAVGLPQPYVSDVARQRYPTTYRRERAEVRRLLRLLHRGSVPAIPSIAADAGMFAVQTRHLRRRPGSRPPTATAPPDACRAAPPRRYRMNVSFRPGRFPSVGLSPRTCSKARTCPRRSPGRAAEPARDGGRRTRRRRGVRGRAGLLPCRLRRAERRGDVGQVEDREEDAEALDDAGAQLRVEGEQAARPAPRLRRSSARSALDLRRRKPTWSATGSRRRSGRSPRARRPGPGSSRPTPSGAARTGGRCRG